LPQGDPGDAGSGAVFIPECWMGLDDGLAGVLFMKRRNLGN